MHPTLLSIILGVGIGLLYKLASRATHRLAERRDPQHSVRIVLGGIAVRMFVAVILIVVVLTQMRVEAGVFVISLLTIMAIGLAHEVWWLHRHSGWGSRIGRQG